MVDEAMQMLDKAVQVRPEYADAIAYKSLVLRQKADQSDTTTRAALEKEADDLLDKVRAIKQKEAAEKAAKSQYTRALCISAPRPRPGRLSFLRSPCGGLPAPPRGVARLLPASYNESHGVRRP